MFSNAVTTVTRFGLRRLTLSRKPGNAQPATLLSCRGSTLFTRKEKELSLNASPRRRKSVEPHAYSGLCRNLGILYGTEERPSEFWPALREEDYAASEYSTESNRFTRDFCHGPDAHSVLEPNRDSWRGEQLLNSERSAMRL